LLKIIKKTLRNIIKIVNQPGAAAVVTLVAVPNVNGTHVQDAVVLALSADSSEIGKADIVAIVVVEPIEMFNGAFEAVLLPSENPKQLYTFIY